MEAVAFCRMDREASRVTPACFSFSSSSSSSPSSFFFFFFFFFRPHRWVFLVAYGEGESTTCAGHLCSTLLLHLRGERRCRGKIYHEPLSAVPITHAQWRSRRSRSSMRRESASSSLAGASLLLLHHHLLLLLFDCFARVVSTTHRPTPRRDLLLLSLSRYDSRRQWESTHDEGALFNASSSPPRLSTSCVSPGEWAGA